MSGRAAAGGKKRLRSNPNGTKIPTEAATLSQLIEQQRIPVAGIAVALGSRVVRREQWETTPLEEGCEITVIRATQGG